MSESLRQYAHVFIGLVAFWLVALLGRVEASYLFFAGGLFALVVLHLHYSGTGVGRLSVCFEHLKRQGQEADLGFYWYLSGLCLLATFLYRQERLLVALVALGLGDALSTLVGRHGRHKIFYNRNKTLEGSFAMLVSCAPAIYLYGPWGAIYALAVTAVESLPIKVNDNLTICAASAVIFNLF
ncbi:hypothetical protein FJZ26_03105 [Candidatus Parvarchaeota archaeon]|nr:hypothetical protein [Candidatus Parvarchaeota archaeon]